MCSCQLFSENFRTTTTLSKSIVNSTKHAKLLFRNKKTLYRIATINKKSIFACAHCVQWPSWFMCLYTFMYLCSLALFFVNSIIFPFACWLFIQNKLHYCEFPKDDTKVVKLFKVYKCNLFGNHCKFTRKKNIFITSKRVYENSMFWSQCFYSFLIFLLLINDDE